MSELYINLPQLKKVPAELSGTPQDIRRKIQSLESIEQYVKSQISGGGELQRQIQSIREELERIAGSVSSYGDALQQICGVYETCEERIVKCGLSSYANAKESGGEDVPWYKTDTFKWVVGAVVVVGTVVAAAVVLTVAAPAILTAVVVGAAIGAATGAIVGGVIGGYTSVKSGGTFEEGAADGFFWGSIGGAVSGAVAGVASATGAGLLGMSAAEGIVNAGMYTAETTYDGGKVSAAGIALSFTTGAVVSAGSVVLAGKASQGLGKLSSLLKNGSKQTVNAAESAVEGSGKGIVSEIDRADDLSSGILNKVKEVEPDVTKIMKSLEKEGAHLEGLDYRLKSGESLSRKILSDAHVKGVTLEEAATSIGDSLRYTLVIDETNYSDIVSKSLRQLQNDGYSISKVKNFWGDEIYQGINVSVVTPDGIKIELQFHTEASYYTKEVLNHSYYEIARSETATIDEIINANDAMIENQSKVNVPSRAEEIISIKGD